jgi:SAM-dependent methyltransferase
VALLVAGPTDAEASDHLSAERTPPERLVETFRGFIGTQLLHAAVRLGIPDALQDGPRSALELAALTGVDPVSLDRTLRGLVALEILDLDTEGRFRETPESALLCSNVSGSLKDGLLLYGGVYYQAWSSLPEALRTGDNAFALTFGTPFWEYLSQHPELAATFSSAMAANSRREAAELASLIDLSGVQTVVDVGGGSAVLMAALLSARPTLQGVVFDLPAALAEAEARLKEVGVADRCRLVGGDFFSEVPPGGSLYILKAILHNWDDRHATAVLRNCRRVMRRDTKLCVVERLRPNEAGEAGLDRGKVLADLEMMVLFGGRERSAEEISALLAASDLRLVGLTPSRAGFSLLEAVAA